jgi:hypothetical protein
MASVAHQPKNHIARASTAQGVMLASIRAPCRSSISSSGTRNWHLFCEGRACGTRVWHWCSELRRVLIGPSLLRRKQMARILVFALVVACGASFTSSPADAQGPVTPFRPGLPFFISTCGRTPAPFCPLDSVPICGGQRECYYFGQRYTECAGWICRRLPPQGDFPRPRRRR